MGVVTLNTSCRSDTESHHLDQRMIAAAPPVSEHRRGGLKTGAMDDENTPPSSRWRSHDGIEIEPNGTRRRLLGGRVLELVSPGQGCAIKAK